MQSPTTTLSGNKTLNNATYNVTNGTTTTESGVLSGGGGLTKQGSGKLILTASNTYSGATLVEAGSLVLSNSGGNAINNSLSITVNSGASLVLGASNQIGDGIALVLDGGTLLVGAGDVTEDLGTLTLNASSIIDFGNFGSILRQLTFDDSTGVTWATNAVLTITNWQGLANQTSEVTKLLFGTGGLTSTQLGQIRFANQNIDGGQLLGGSGELAPIPEAPVVGGAFAIAAFVVWRERRRILVTLRSLTKPSARCR
jgi:autotransporter-associated beta strand protein